MTMTQTTHVRQKKRAWPFGAMVEPLLLSNGDRLTRAEFERRYHAMPKMTKAELIEGVVHMPSPVSYKHAEPHSYVITWLGVYGAATRGVQLLDYATVRLDSDNEVQPDALMRIEPAAGGHSRVTPDDYIEGAPELIVEVSFSSASYDVHDKLNVYRRNGVQEYVVWRVQDEALDWWELSEGAYAPLPPDAQGVIHSRVLPGLNLHVDKLLDGDLAGVLAELQQGLSIEAHQALVEKLRSSIAE
jgi:Uma2 family endonuclease